MKSTISGWSMSRQTIFAARRVVPPLLVAPAARSSTSRKLMRPELVPPPESFSCLPRIGAEVRARARAVLEEARLALHELVDAHQVVVDGLDEARRALRALVRVGRLDDARRSSPRHPRETAARALDAVAVPEAAVEPHGELNAPYWLTSRKRQLGLERVGVLLSWRSSRRTARRPRGSCARGGRRPGARSSRRLLLVAVEPALRKYFDTTMSVASCDQPLGISAPPS
jgi:hypothetical protein